MIDIKKLNRSFYLQDTITVAKQLLGKYIIRKINDIEIIVKITETEAYIGDIDKACHAYKRKRTKRTDVMFNEGGYAYVYLIYGMYYCLNIVAEEKDNPCAVLIRGVSPVKGIDEMALFRYGKKYNELSKYQMTNFLNGPGKLCRALNITKELNGKDLTGDEIYICDGETIENKDINISKRINIDYAEEAKDFLWRFFI